MSLPNSTEATSHKNIFNFSLSLFSKIFGPLCWGLTPLKTSGFKNVYGQGSYSLFRHFDNLSYILLQGYGAPDDRVQSLYRDEAAPLLLTAHRDEIYVLDKRDYRNKLRLVILIPFHTKNGYAKPPIWYYLFIVYTNPAVDRCIKHFLHTHSQQAAVIKSSVLIT